MSVDGKRLCQEVLQEKIILLALMYKGMCSAPTNQPNWVFIQWCWWCRGCELLQRHSDIKVTDAAGINHIGKVYCGNFDCKTESKADEWNQTPRYSQSLHATAPSLKVIVWIFGICCFLMLSVFLYSVLFESSIPFCIRLMINCVGNEKEGEFNFNTWQRRNRTKNQYSSKLKRCWGPEDP